MIFSGLPWYPDEDDLLLEAVRGGMNARQIGEAIGRTDTSVRARLQHLRRLGFIVFIRQPKARRPTAEEVYAEIGGYQDVAEAARPRPAKTALPWR